MITCHFDENDLPSYRIIKIGPADLYQLCDAEDPDAFGFCRASVDRDYGDVRRVVTRNGTHEIVYSTLPFSDPRRVDINPDPLVLIEAMDRSRIAWGGAVFQAADGCISDFGTIRVGIAVRKASKTIWEILPC